MNRWICNMAIFVSVVGAHVMTPLESKAGPFLDWLSGRAPYYQPQPWHVDRRYPYSQPAPQVPQVSYAAQPAYETGVAFQQPTTIQQPTTFQPPQEFQTTPFVQPATTISPAPFAQGQRPASCWEGCWLTRLFCSPRTAYRSSWVRVPVTRYRPALGTGNAYGVPGTQPCAGYAWRLRRVPVSTYRPFSGLWNGLTAASQPASSFGTQNPCVTYGTAIPQAMPQGSPYYPAQPGAVSGATTVVPFNPNSPTMAPNSGNQPADRAPSLNPTGIPTNPQTMTTPSVPKPVTQSVMTPIRDDRNIWGGTQTKSGFATTVPSIQKTPVTQSRPSNFFQVTPIRDPKSNLGRPKAGDIPPLLAPTNNSATNDPSTQNRVWQVIPIDWGKAQRHDSRPLHPAAAPYVAPRPVQRNFDAGGWQSAR